ncbi:stalk domain-containing protein [Bacillus sp. FJAT-49736]|uniref:stalk domain-containing protein n=1 Tax=Bacillus sp. FJAT-49736 TaxID=2833582 RepID=UPI001BC9EB66|nr:stalk domain-containing protein [Bacillus sp. FJAT-49736]MBS4174277.1 hypothetical protein [Bacillus sp. FJAT-49736]
MKKLFLTITLLFSFIVPTITHTSTAASSIILKVNNEQVDSNYSPFVENGTTYVPLNEIARLMGDKVTSLSYRNEVSIEGKDFKASVCEGYIVGFINGRTLPLKTKTVDGKEVNANVKAIYKNGEIYVPIEFISNGNGMTYPVDTVNENHTTTIYIGKLPVNIQNRNNNIILKVNNKQVSDKYKPFVQADTTYVPLDEISKKMGSDTTPRKNQVTVSLTNLKYTTVKAGQTSAFRYDPYKGNDVYTKIPLKMNTIHGNTMNSNAKAIYKNGQIFVPVEFISLSDGMNFYVETVKDNTKTTIYVGELPAGLQQPINKLGYATTEYAGVSKSPGGIYSINALVKNQQVTIYSSQAKWYKIKVGKQIGYVEKNKLKIGKTPAKGKMYPDGWVAPVLKSKWSPNQATNFKTLQNELGFTDNGHIFGVYKASKAIIVLGDSGNTEVTFQFFCWDGDANGAIPQEYRVPIVAKELFKLYFGKDATRVWKYCDKGDIPDKFTANGRTVKVSFIKATGSLYFQVGKKK